MWIIRLAACNVSTLGHGGGFFSLSGPVAAVPILPVAPALRRGWREPWSHPAQTREQRRAPGIAWRWLTARRIYLRGSSAPSQPAKQVSVCQIAPFRSAAFGQTGRQPWGFVTKSYSADCMAKSIALFLCSNPHLLQEDSMWQKTTKRSPRKCIQSMMASVPEFEEVVKPNASVSFL